MVNLSKLGSPAVDIGYEVRLEGEATPDQPSVGFSSGGFAALEAAGIATISLQRQGELGAASSVRVRSTGGTATAGTDFVAVDRVIGFTPGAGSVSFDVTLLNDGAVEGDETVELALSNPVGAELGNPRRASLTIEDDDSVATLSFVSEATIVTETAGTAQVLVERTGSTSGAVSVAYEVLALSATEGVDYGIAMGGMNGSISGGLNGTVVWGDGEDGTKAIELTLLDDPEEEGSELARLELSSPSAGARLGGTTIAGLVIADDEAPSECVPSDRALCLHEGRFRVEVDWYVAQRGETGTGGADPDSRQTGLFWFFTPENIELIVKILDGRAFTGAYWLFYGALSDVEYWVIASDLDAGTTRVYRNQQGSLQGLADVVAFPDPSALPPPEDLAVFDVVPGGSVRSGRGPGGGPLCVPGPETLCLLDGRFQVEVGWEDLRGGDSGTGAAVPRTDQSGLYWFFNPENIELVVKILDARSINDRFWVFYGALSDVSYTITVTDTMTGAVREYINPQGSIAGGADVSAFEPELTPP